MSEKKENISLDWIVLAVSSIFIGLAGIISGIVAMPQLVENNGIIAESVLLFIITLLCGILMITLKSLADIEYEKINGVEKP